MDIQKILSDPQFLKELDHAINAGKSVDYGWNENLQEESEIDIFNADQARSAIIELLNEYFIK